MEPMLDINENSVSAVLLNDGWHQPKAAGTLKSTIFGFMRSGGRR
jgi:hypothetical protein